MRASKIAVRAALVCSAAGIACAIWSAADETPARAADGGTGLLPATVDVAGDLADAPARTVEQPLRHVTQLGRTAPAPIRAAVEPAAQVVSTVVDTAGPASHAPQPAEPRAEQLRDPDAEPTTKPTAEPVPAVVLLTGPAPSTVTVDPAAARAAAAFALPCDGTAASPHRRGTPRPDWARCTPDGRDDTTTGLAQVKPPTKTGVDQLAATTPTDPATLALRLLGELLPRSDLPTGRTEHPEPGPA